MFNLSGSELRETLADVEAHYLAGTYKPESGKYAKKRLFSAATTSAKAAFREVDSNSRILTSLLDDLCPGLGSAQIASKLSKFDADIMTRGAGILAVSADISAWSTNHKRRLVENRFVQRISFNANLQET